MSEINNVSEMQQIQSNTLTRKASASIDFVEVNFTLTSKMY